MPIDPDRLSRLSFETEQTWSVRDTLLYALGAGAGMDVEREPRALRYVYEEGLLALPTMAVVLAYPGFWLKDPEHGVDWRRVLHGEQSIRLTGALPVSGRLRGVTRVDGLYDRGPEKGALLTSSRTISDAATGETVAVVSQSAVLRGDGGFNGSADGAPKPHPVPDDRPPDAVLTLATRPEQALIYRLSGDWNPLHADPEVARQGGFARPILHGLCTYGVAGRAVLDLLCDHEPARLRRFDARFSSPVYPGDTIEVRVWREGPGRAALIARCLERDVVVLANGRVDYEA
jgi:acyl dehydratase